MRRSRITIAAVVVPALLVGVLLGEWVGRQLFPTTPSTADGRAAAPQRPIEVTVVFPSASAALSTSGPPAAAQESPPQGLPPGNPGNPGNSGNSGNQGGGNPLPQPPPQPPAPTTAGPPPAPTWGSQLNTSIQVLGTYPTGGTVQLGSAQGWFQMHTDRTRFRYSFTFCRQSSYMLPSMAVSVNGRYVGQTWQSTHITTINPPYSGGGCTSGTVSDEHSYSPIQNVYLKLSGSTFLGSEHTVVTQDRTFYGPN